MAGPDEEDSGLARAPSSLPLPARYRDCGRIAAGGFGEVRRVQDLHLGNTLAMKILRIDALGEDSRRRFEAEARLTAWLRHPGTSRR